MPRILKRTGAIASTLVVERQTLIEDRYAAETDPLFVLLLFLAPGLAWADKTDDYIRTDMKRQNIPGLSLVVIKDGHIIKAEGYGLAKHQVEDSDHTQNPPQNRLRQQAIEGSSITVAACRGFGPTSLG
jgi:hypothetical protein